MPFGLKWPFGRKKAANQAQPPAASSEPVSVQRAPAGDAPSLAHEPRTFELGAEVMSRAAEFGTLPTLGQDAGLNIAQNVSEVGRFMQHLPNSNNLITAAELPDTSDFVASLASLSSFTNLESTPVLMGELIAPSGLTDELPPLGSLPNQLPGLMGVAPITPDASVINVMPTPMPPPMQAVEPIAEVTAREVVAPLLTVTALPETTAALINDRPFETLAPLAVEQPLLAPIEQLVPDVPALVPASFVSPTPTTDSGREVIETSVRIEPSTASDFSAPTVPTLALNTFTESLPLINLPGETGKVEAPSIVPSITREAAPVFDLPIKTGDFDLPLTLPELTPTTGPSVRDGAAPSESATPSAPLSISRYAEDLPLPAPIAPGEESPTALNVPSVELPVVAPLPASVQREDSLAGPFEARSVGEVAQDLVVRPLPIDQSPVDQLPGSQLAADTSPATSESALSISRFAEDLPLIDLYFGWAEFEPQPIEPSFAEATSMPTEALPLPATTTPAMALPSIGERADRAATRSDRAPISISRFSSDLPLNRSTTLNQVTQIQRFSLGSLTQNLPSLGGVTDNLPSLGGLAQNIPSLGGMAENLPSLGGLTDNLPSLGGPAESIGGQLPQMPSLGGLASSQMPLPPSISDAIGGLGGAGQEALGQITSMAPSMPEMPAMPQMPSIEKLTDQVWREIQKKLKIERERTRGLA
ncbi:MAG: hypothetical protein HY870_14640 [Chloroflexi bacterium]|nr:hypothetical protein [Chloroflexota bacterium]